MKSGGTAVTIVGCEKTYARAGIAYRRTKAGPESELIERFLLQYPFKQARGNRVTIFREPCLESGFPDLVVVFWSEATASTWNASRASITAFDLRLMQYLFRQGPCTFPHLNAIFSRKASASLERLKSAEMVRQSKDRWSSRSLSKCFAVKSIISIEAKIADWRGALQQAALNTWFASASYVLLPRVPRGSDLLEAANNLGIGVWAHGETLCEHSPTSAEQLPRSYASWLFNEWAWRSSELRGDILQ